MKHQPFTCIDIIDGEDIFLSEKWGVLRFFESKMNECKSMCRYCLLLEEFEECMIAPCRSGDRRDKREGFFSIRQFPNK